MPNKIIHFKNDLFEIKETEEKECFSLKYNHKLVDTRGTIHYGKIMFDSIDMLSEQFLDASAEEFPDNVEFTLEALTKHEGNHIFLLKTFKEKGIFTFNFFFSIQEDDFDNLNINPVKHLYIFFDLVSEAGYKTSYSREDHMENKNGNIYISFASKGNIKEHYQKQLNILDGFYKKAGEQMGYKNHTIFRQKDNV